MDKASFFLFNIILNSLMAFITVWFLIEGLIFMLRIPQGRVAAILRMIPLVKLLLDVCLYDFAQWSYLHGINPLEYPEGSRILSAMVSWMGDNFWPISSGVRLSVAEMSFTVADLIAYTLPPALLNAMVILIVTISLFLLGRKLQHYHFSLKTLRALMQEAQPVGRKIRNSKVASLIQKRRCQILTGCAFTGSPFAAGCHLPIVYIPEALSQNLSRKEYEAVLVHEMEHLRHKDSIVRCVLECIASIFWWIPTKWLRQRIEEGQETGCDLNCSKYGVDPLNLASAIYKAARQTAVADLPLNYLAKHPVHRRVKRLLQQPSGGFKAAHFARSLIARGIALAITFCVLLFGKFWIF